jgi:hypothetical protein
MGSNLKQKATRRAQNAYKMLSIRAWIDFASVMDKYGRPDLRDKYNGYANDKIAEIRTNSLWLSDFGIHASSDAVNTGLLNSDEQNSIFEKHFLDRVNRLSLSPFNQYFIINNIASN